MKIVFKSDEFAELNFVREYTEGYDVSDKNGIRELKSDTDYMGIHSKMHRIFLPGMIFSMNQGSLDTDLVQILESDFPYLQMHFELSTSGCLYYPDAKFDVKTVIYGGSHSLLFYPALKGKLYYLKKPDSFSVEIELSVDFLRRIFDNDLEILKTFGENIEKNFPAVLGGKSYPITPKMKQILFEVRDYRGAGTLKRLYVEAKVIELLVLQINQINELETKKTALRGTDIDKLHEIKDLLTRTVHNPFSIEELAKIAGINRTKLQDGFKELFGTTIFGYLSDSRLEEAKKQILDVDHISISEVATQAGYKNHQHFTAAFKKKYGFLPKDLRKNI